MNTGTDMTDTRMMSTSIMGTNITMNTVRAAPAGIIMNTAGTNITTTITVFCRRHAPLLIPKLHASFT